MCSGLTKHCQSHSRGGRQCVPLMCTGKIIWRKRENGPLVGHGLWRWPYQSAGLRSGYAALHFDASKLLATDTFACQRLSPDPPFHHDKCLSALLACVHMTSFPLSRKVLATVPSSVFYFSLPSLILTRRASLIFNIKVDNIGCLIRSNEIKH